MSHLSPVSRSSEGGHQGQTGHHHPHGLPVPWAEADREKDAGGREYAREAGLIQTSLAARQLNFLRASWGERAFWRNSSACFIHGTPTASPVLGAHA
jgi:hypothetical protein